MAFRASCILACIAACYAQILPDRLDYNETDDEFARHAYGRLGRWMPHNDSAVADYMNIIKETHKEKLLAPLIPEVQTLSDLIDDSPTMRLSMSMAIREAQMTRRPTLRRASSGIPFNNTQELMALLNVIVTSEPPAFTSEGDQMIGFPINALMLWMMSAPHGYVVFRDHRFNAALKTVLGTYESFLDSNASTIYLNNGSRGWFSPQAQQLIKFDEVVHDSGKPHWGWTSWNDFFTRKFVPGARPIAEPDNDKVIISGCEATPYKIAHNVQLKDVFWLKGQPYSLQDMFTKHKEELAKEFEGGSIYQAFLNAFDYHRWTSPVTGLVKELYSVPGTYYSQSELVGRDPGAPDDSQGYLTNVAARMIYVIEADDPQIGLVAVIQVGMAECSSTVSTVKIGQRLNKGDEIGMFKFGGSTFCNVFQKGVIRNFTVTVDPNGGNAVKLNAQIAVAN